MYTKLECKAPRFESAGNHFNPDDKKHGLLNPKGAENGDLPNVIADGSGKIKAEIDAPHITLEEGKRRFIEKMERLLLLQKTLMMA